MKRLFLSLTVLFTVISLMACDIIDLATEIINDPPVIKNVSFNHSDETISIDIGNMPENGSLHSIRINGTDVDFEEDNGRFVIQMFELERTNIINRFEVDTGQRILPIPVGYNLDTIIEEQLYELVSNQVFIPHFLQGTTVEATTVISDLETLKSFYEDYIEAHYDEPLIHKVIDAELDVLSTFINEHTIVAFNQTIESENEVLKVSEFSVTDDVLVIRVQEHVQSNDSSGIVIVVLPEQLSFETVNINVD